MLWRNKQSAPLITAEALAGLAAEGRAVVLNETWRNVIIAGCLVLLWGLEAWLPAAPGRDHRLRHATRNLSLGLFNAGALALLAAPLLVQAALWAEGNGFGLLRVLNLPPLLTTLLAIALLDGWMYLWHRANHRIPFLWRFHRVHHSDPEMDVTTAVRFHTGEILISAALRLALIPLLGVSLAQTLLYDALLLPVILFHHSNVRFPERFDRALRALIASPAMHRVHHSRARIETDSNYSSVFSFWDRLGGTFRLRRDGQAVNFGLDEYDGEQWQRIAGLLITPFVSARGDLTFERGSGLKF